MSGFPCAASLAGLTLLWASTLAPAAAQPAGLADFTWTFSGDPSGSATVGTDTLHIVGPSEDLCVTSDYYARLTTTATAAGTVSAHYDFDNDDYGFGWWTAEDPVYILNDEVTYVGPGDIFDTWSGDVSFEVQAGDVFGFGVASIDCSFGPGVLEVSAFSFVADAWQELGHGLAGTFGEPTLVGLGTLAPGSFYTLSMVDAAQFAPAWLILGFAQLGAPFKGGVLVPDPAPPAALLLFDTGPNGRIILSGSWPAGLPSGLTFFMQYWIVDAAGPAGFAATNALSATMP
jgi:hypothetical protein